MFVIYFLVSLVFFALGIGLYFIWRWLKKKRALDLLQMELFLVKLPFQSKEGKDLKKEVALFEQLVSNLASFKKPFVFEAAVPFLGEEIHFYVAVPARVGVTLVRQIYSLWGGASVERVQDYNIFNSDGVTMGASLVLLRRFLLPIRTYQEIDSDTFQAILGGLSQIKEIGEGGAIQIVIMPKTPKKIRREVESTLLVLRKGWKLKDALRRSITFGQVIDAINPEKLRREQQQKKNEPMGPRPMEEFAIKAIERKATKPLFEVNIRIMASAPTQVQSEEILNSLAAGFSQFGAVENNELKVVRARDLQKLAYRFAYREFDSSRVMILNAEEVASLFHFPTPFTEIPKIKALKSKEAAPPSILARDGAVIGESVFRGDAKEIKVSDGDRRRHVYVIGQTGTGKSTLITNMVSQDIKSGKGVCVIDPHGDLVNTVLSQVPENRKDDVIVFDPSDLNQPMGLNMLEYNFSRPEEKTFIVNELIGIFDKLYDLKATGGPMFEQYMRNAVLLLMEDMPNEPATLMEVQRVFVDAAFRKRKLERIHNPVVVDFWQKEAEKAGGEAALQNITPYVTSKFNTFTANDYTRVIIGQEKSAFDFRKVMDEGKILLVNLSKGRIGDINANLLGMIFVGKILMAALSRVDVQEEARRDFNLYVDEFQNFTTDSIATILSEARKYHLNLVVAHQFIAQLSEKIRDSVFGNVGSMIVFRVGIQDAEFLVKQFQPEFDQKDLVNIDNFNAYAKLLINGQTTKPFNVRTLMTPKGSQAVVAELQELSRRKYGASREDVEAGIYRRLRN